jgi:glycosyltransferase involved in cell wall biosynthesis
MGQSVAVVVSSFNQGVMIREAVDSVLGQSLEPIDLIVVDDGSTDIASLEVLANLERDGVPVLRQSNGGVSAARNAGIRAIDADLVAVLDGDDRYQPRYLEAVVAEFGDDDVVAASSWLSLFGTATGVVCPPGGQVVDFLARNSCPASAVFRRHLWDAAGGYDEDLREGFEDWDFFLRLLTPGGRIQIVTEPLVEYRTQPGSANLEGMTRRLRLYGEIIDRHTAVFTSHVRAALLAQESISMERLARWEKLVLEDRSIDPGVASYGDGGMAALVRIAAARSALPESTSASSPSERRVLDAALNKPRH